jgi:hypothetical protein
MPVRLLKQGRTDGSWPPGAAQAGRELEGFQFLHMTLQQVLRTNWSSAIKILG